MKILNSFKNIITTLDEKDFFKYLFIVLGIFLLFLGLTFYYYYSTVKFWNKRINTINALRDEVKTIIDRDELVQKQRQEVNTMLEEQPDFKIEGYYKALISKMELNRNEISHTTETVDRGDREYQEVLLNAKFDMMNMKQLAELLEEFEHNKRIYTKTLEIIKSKKVPNAIEVAVTIATLQRKREVTEFGE